MAFKLVTTTQADRGVTSIANLSNEALNAEYDRVTRLLTDEINLFTSSQPSKNEALLMTLAAEGKKRRILYFLDSDELLATCKEIFGQGTTWAK